MIQDLRYALRLLRKNPGFTFVALLTVAVGIGSTTSVYTVVDAVLLRPLPYTDVDRLVQVWETDERQNQDQRVISPLNLQDWRASTRTLEELAGYRYVSPTLSGVDELERLTGVAVSANFFAALGVGPTLGRGFRPDDDLPTSACVVVLSDALWRRRFGTDPNVLGRSVTLDRESCGVVGVASATFRFPEALDLWMPLRLDTARLSRGQHFLYAIGRLRRGVDLEAARAEMRTIAARLAGEYPGTNRDWSVNLVPLHEQMIGPLRPSLLALLGAAALVLLIVCANMASLLLSRALTRQHELALRAALGASQSRLARQALVEGLVLAALGGGAGVALALWGADVLLAASPAELGRFAEVHLDLRVLAASMAIVLGAGLFFSTAPAVQAMRTDVRGQLQSGARSGPPRGGRRVRKALVVCQIAIAFGPLAAGGLLFNSLTLLQRVDTGFDPRRVVTAQVSLSPLPYAAADRQATFLRNVLNRLAVVPGAAVVGATTDLPFSQSRSRTSFSIDGRPSTAEMVLDADIRAISPRYFAAMGIRLVRGRAFTDRDAFKAAPVVIVNETMARRFWPGQDPVGRRLTIGSMTEIERYGRPVSREIVGVVGDIRHEQLDAEPAPEMCVPYDQLPARRVALAIRAAGDPTTLVPLIRRAVLAVDPDQAVYGVQLMDERVARSLAAARFNTVLFGLFGGVALLLATIGIYGVMAHAVTARAREIAIRLSVGATVGEVLWQIGREGLQVLAAGLLLGLAGGLVVTRMVTSLLFGVRPDDPWTFATITVVLGASATVAFVIPARRAAKIDPLTLLKGE